VFGFPDCAAPNPGEAAPKDVDAAGLPNPKLLAGALVATGVDAPNPNPLGFAAGAVVVDPKREGVVELLVDELVPIPKPVDPKSEGVEDVALGAVEVPKREGVVVLDVVADGVPNPKLVVPVDGVAVVPKLKPEVVVAPSVLLG